MTVPQPSSLHHAYLPHKVYKVDAYKVSFFCVLSSCRSKLKSIDIIIPNKERQKYTLAIGLLKYKYVIEQY